MDIELVSASITKEYGEKAFCYTLLNIPGQRYTFGPTYLGERENEEFFFYGFHSHSYSHHETGQTFTISVDEKGQFWIEEIKSKGTRIPRKKSPLLVNRKKVRRKVLLQVGDTIAFIKPGSFGGKCQLILDVFRNTFLLLFRAPFCYPLESPVLFVRERKSNVKLEELCEENGSFHINLWENSLVLSKIFSFLNLHSLLTCRQVSKYWEENSRLTITKRGKVSLNFCGESGYFDPSLSLKIFRFLHSVKLLRLKTLELTIPPLMNYPEHPVPLHQSFSKMLKDLEKLVKSSPFSSLILHLYYQGSSNMEIFFMLIFSMNFLEEVVITKTDFNRVILVKPFTALKNVLLEFTQKYNIPCKCHIPGNLELEMWAYLLSKILTCVKTLYVKDGWQLKLENKLPNLKEIYLSNIPLLTLNHLLTFKGQLTVLEIVGIRIPASKSDTESLRNVLHFHSETLKRLRIEFPFDYEGTLNSLPVFPKLEEFSLVYSRNLVVKWGENGSLLNYLEVFPCLRKLEVIPRGFSLGWVSNWARVPFDWGNEGEAFSSFFPDFGKEVLSVRELGGLREYTHYVFGASNEDRETVWRKLKNIVEMFPNVRDEKWMEVRKMRLD